MIEENLNLPYIEHYAMKYDSQGVQRCQFCAIEIHKKALTQPHPKSKIGNEGYVYIKNIITKIGMPLKIVCYDAPSEGFEKCTTI